MPWHGVGRSGDEGASEEDMIQRAYGEETEESEYGSTR